MCGFAGMFGLQGRLAEAATLRKMSAAVIHRGPDDDGYFIDRHAGFGFRRLAILDLSPNGHQPMTTSDGRYTIVFNGEIYNYVELRKELIASGHVFRSTGDTEVLLHAYQEWGARCVGRLNGMWALLIFDARTGNLFGSRDRFGIKPLFFWRSESVCLFGSEIKCIRASGLYQDQVNWNTAARFLVQGSLDQGTETFYQGVTSIPPATWFELTPDGRYTERKFWVPPQRGERDGADIVACFAGLFEDAVNIHSRSDVPVAVHLSGGLDSTSIICELGRLRDKSSPSQDIQALSYMPQEFDESRYISETIQQTRAKLVRLSATPDQLWQSLEDVLWFHDEPIHSMTALVSYALMRETARHGIKVVLNGQGGDETLAGYPSYFGIFWQQLLRTKGLSAAAREIGAYAQAHGDSFWRILFGQLRFFTQSKLAGFAAYRRGSVVRRNARREIKTWYTQDLLSHLRQDPYTRFDLSLRDTLVRSIVEDPLPLYLRVEDRNSMAWSVESRVPFLDYRLVELALAADCRSLMHGPYGKYLLRQGMADKIPESVRLRIDKMGFPTSARRWLANELFEPVCKLLSSRALAESGMFELSQVRRDVHLFRQGKADIADKLFRLAQFAVWLDRPKQPRLASAYEMA